MIKQIIITAMIALVAMTGQGQETTGRVMLTDSIAIFCPQRAKTSMEY